MKRIFVVVFLVTFAAVATASLVLSLRQQTASHVPPRTRGLPAGMEDEIRSLGEEVERLERRIEAARRPASARPQPRADDPAEEGDTAAPKSLPAAERPVAAAVELEERLSREPVDAAWAHDAARGIESAISSVAKGTKVLRAQCGSTVCRVVVEHTTAEAQRDLGRSLAREEPFHQGVLYEYSEGAVPPSTTLYVLRDGESFRSADGAEMIHP